MTRASAGRRPRPARRPRRAGRTPAARARVTRQCQAPGRVGSCRVRSSSEWLRWASASKARPATPGGQRPAVVAERRPRRRCAPTSSSPATMEPVEPRADAAGRPAGADDRGEAGQQEDCRPLVAVASRPATASRPADRAATRNGATPRLSPYGVVRSAGMPPPPRLPEPTGSVTSHATTGIPRSRNRSRFSSSSSSHARVRESLGRRRAGLDDRLGGHLDHRHPHPLRRHLGHGGHGVEVGQRRDGQHHGAGRQRLPRQPAQALPRDAPCDARPRAGCRRCGRAARGPMPGVTHSRLLPNRTSPTRSRSPR